MTIQPSYELLTGKDIILRKAEENDYKSMLYHIWSDKDVYDRMLFQPNFTEEEALARCRRSILYQKDNFAWFVALKSTNEAIGLCAIRENGAGHFEESGICVGKEFWGRGFGTEIVSLLLDLSFNNLCAEDFRYGFFSDNLRSEKLAKKFGFTYDRTEKMIRPWDGAEKTVVSCLLTKEKYNSLTAK